MPPVTSKSSIWLRPPICGDTKSNMGGYSASVYPQNPVHPRSVPILQPGMLTEDWKNYKLQWDFLKKLSDELKTMDSVIVDWFLVMMKIAYTQEFKVLRLSNPTSRSGNALSTSSQNMALWTKLSVQKTRITQRPSGIYKMDGKHSPCTQMKGTSFPCLIHIQSRIMSLLTQPLGDWSNRSILEPIQVMAWATRRG